MSPSRFIRLEVENRVKTVIHLLESTSQTSIPDEGVMDYILYKLDEITSFCEGQYLVSRNCDRKNSRLSEDLKTCYSNHAKSRNRHCN